MSVQTKTVSIEVAKETSEVFDVLEALVIAIKEKKSVAEIAATILPKAFTAIEGVDKLGEELKSAQFYETAAIGGARLTRALVGQEE